MADDFDGDVVSQTVLNLRECDQFEEIPTQGLHAFDAGVCGVDRPAGLPVETGKQGLSLSIDDTRVFTAYFTAVHDGFLVVSTFDEIRDPCLVLTHADPRKARRIAVNAQRGAPYHVHQPGDHREDQPHEIREEVQIYAPNVQWLPDHSDLFPDPSPLSGSDFLSTGLFGLFRFLLAISVSYALRRWVGSCLATLDITPATARMSATFCVPGFDVDRASCATSSSTSSTNPASSFRIFSAYFVVASTDSPSLFACSFFACSFFACSSRASCIDFTLSSMLPITASFLRYSKSLLSSAGDRTATL